MKLESSYALKPPCYGRDLIDKTTDPTCLHGSEFNRKYTQSIMGGKFGNPYISIVNDDNFHRVEAVKPVHLPEIDSTCAANVSKPCRLNTVTISQNHYQFLDKVDTGYYPISAHEIKTKISSRQRTEIAAGNPKADFYYTDEVGDRCAEINDFSIDWAFKNLSPAAKARYQQYGTKMQTGPDLGPFNAGPLWIWKFMQYTESEDKSTMTVQSPMMRTPIDYPVKSAAGFHYCKVLSPFRAMEYMYIDSLFYGDGVYLEYENTTSFDESAYDLFLQ